MLFTILKKFKKCILSKIHAMFAALSRHIIALCFLLLLLLCSLSPNDVPPEPQRNVSIAAVRGAVRPSSLFLAIEILPLYMSVTKLLRHERLSVLDKIRIHHFPNLFCPK